MSKKKGRDPLEYWRNYKGPVGKGNWREPTSRQQFYGMLLRLGSLWYRLQTAGLYWPPLLEVLKALEKEVSNKLRAFEAALELARPRTRIKETEAFHASFYALLREIKTYEPSMIWSDAHLEIREHRNSQCGICGCELLWPAVVVYNKAQRSADIGVHCLESLVEKMQHFLRILQEKTEAIHVLH